MIVGISVFLALAALVVALAWHHEKKLQGYEEEYYDLD